MAMNEMSNPILPPLTMRNKSKIEKASHLLESTLENLVRSQKKPMKYQKLLTIILHAIEIVTFIIAYVAILRHDFRKIASKEDWEFYVLIKIFLTLGLPCLPGKPKNIKKYEYHRHFTDIGVSAIRRYLAFTVFLMINILVSLIYGVIGLDLCTFIGHIIAFFFSVASIVVACQEANKIRFDPCEDNHLYSLITSVSKDKGSVRIVESSVFKITLHNHGQEIWNSDTFILHRHTGTCQKGECVKFNLPQFTLLPQQQIDLVPETFVYDGDCIRVPKFHCFGSTDRYDQVKTFITDEKRLGCHTTDGNGTTICTCAVEGIAELVVTYSKNSNVNVMVS